MATTTITPPTPAPVLPTSYPTIAMDALGAPTTPAKIPPAPISTAHDGLQGAMETHADQFTQGLADNAAAAKATKDDSYQALLTSIMGTPGTATLTDEAYKNTGVDSADSELKDINNQILQEQESLRRSVEKVQKNESGQFGGAVEQQVQELKDKSLSRQADLAVIQLSKQGKYDSAKTIADRAVAATVEQGQQRISVLQKMYDENKDLFTTAEQEQFQTQQDDRKRELDEKTYEQRAKYDQIIKQSDPLYQAQLAAAQQAVTSAITTGAPVTTSARDGSDIITAVATIGKAAKLSATTQTSLGNILGVIQSAQALAQNNPGGSFGGISPLNTVLDMHIPYTQVGLPFRQAATSAAGTSNRGYLEGINLKVQQWASGASLTNAQTEQVKKMVPTADDTDMKVKEKLNNLVNFMQAQISGALAPEGVVYQPTTVDMFDSQSLDDIFSDTPA